MSYLKVAGDESLVRDVVSKAIINTNNKDYELYLARKNASKCQKLEIERQAHELDCVKNDLSEIKQMISLLISRR
jgi:saccharopine dehydrogenase-like NADP-dependent oxidoreductase